MTYIHEIEWVCSFNLKPPHGASALEPTLDHSSPVRCVVLFVDGRCPSWRWL